MSFGFSVGDFLAVLELANRVRKGFLGAPKEFKAISDNVRDLSIVLQDAEANTDKLAPAQLQEYQDTLQSCKGLLLEIDSVLQKYCTITEVGKIGVRRTLKRTWKRLKWEPEDVRDIRSQITVKIATLNSLNSHVLVTNVAKLVRHQEDSEFQSLLEWLNNTSFVLQQNDLALHCQPGSRRWLFESPVYQDWVKQKDGLLFCPGNAGTGKTYTMAMVIENLRSSNDSDVLTVYMYCTYRNHTQTIEDLYRSLLRLVLEEAGPSDSEETMQACVQYRLSRKPLSRHDCLKLLQIHVSMIPKVNLLVDALDELPSEIRRPFVNDLLKLSEAGNISLFLTSRDIPEIRAPFQKCKTYASLEIRSSDEDIQSFLRDNTFQLPNFVARSPVLQKDVIDAITDASSGMFLLAELHLKSLTTAISPGSLRARLSDIVIKSNAYDELYESTVERIGFQGPQARQVAMQTLLVLTSARYPLSSAELTHALAIDDCSNGFNEDMVPDMDDLIAACHGLVVVDGTSDIVRLVHKSAQEYFERTRSRWFPAAHVTMAKLCLRYLEMGQPGGILPEGAERQAFFQYATANWIYHSSEAENESLDTRDPLPQVSSSPGLVTGHPEADRALVAQSSLRQIAREVFDVHTTIVEACRAGRLAWVEQLLIIRNYNPNQRDRSWEFQFENFDSRRPMVPAYFDGPIEHPSQDDVLLTVATSQRNYSMAAMLLAHGADPNIANIHGQTPLSIAARNGFDDLTSLLLSHDLIKPDLKNSSAPSALLTSIEHGHEKCYQLLLERSDRMATDKNGNGVVWYAARYGHLKIVMELHKWPEIGAALEELPFCHTPIVAAIVGGHQDIAEFLLPLTPELICRQCSLRLAHLAVQVGFDDLLTGLLERDPSNADHKSTQLRQLWIARLLRTCGQYTEEIMVLPTPFLTAIRLGNVSAVQAILPYVDVNRETNMQEAEVNGRGSWRALHEAVNRGNLDMVELLLSKHGIDPDPIDDAGRSPFLLAAQRGNCSIMTALINHGNIDYSRKAGGESAIDYILTHYKNPRYVKTLASVMCTKFSHQDSTGSTLLHRACRFAPFMDRKNVPIVAEILSIPGVDVNIRDQDGNTPLHLAVRYHLRDVVRLLLDRADTDVVAEDPDGNHALNLAYKTGLVSDGVRGDGYWRPYRTKANFPYSLGEWAEVQTSKFFLPSYRAYDESIFMMLVRDKRSNLEHKNHNGESAMVITALTGTKAMVQMALSNATLMSDLGTTNQNGCSLISCAIQANPYPDAVELLRANYPIPPVELEDKETVGL
ncbi:hypothetical protein PFICI_13207 [Pestalotiopsis fici W106-1]|uniref:Uncharacterized protein n=1 Tax=Pestalotiopsis fici (strain W106-1 / CGMCC3.15140) TaxID=1229662 RepID=W3WLK6_PESFW|nr:uncharacterized protein PFICI_13207 [Pestalotiopsis fici W106-1]ETS74723.1 hypothetical protein PFICI_13207 [Pestalotiopsis fici W106-1]